MGSRGWIWDFSLFLTDNEGRVKWSFDLADSGYELRYQPYTDSCRYCYPFLYLVVCEPQETTVRNGIEVYRPAHFHLLTLDLTSGRMVQDVRFTHRPADACRIEDTDEAGLLVSENGSVVHYFSRA